MGIRCCATSFRWSDVRTVWLALALVLLGAAEASGQRLVVEGRSRHPAVSALREIADRGTYRVIDRDTVLPATFRAEGDLVVVDAAVRLEGAVTGSVAVVGGAFFLRPGARVGGVISAVAGTIGMSTLGTVGDTVSLPLEYGVQVERAGEEYVVAVESPSRPPLVTPEGFFGVLIPSYDRVNGVMIRAGLGGNLGADSLRPTYRIVGSYAAERGAVGAIGEIRVPIGAGTRLFARGGREVLTRDAWIRGELSNSLSALFVRSDVRNYYESDYASVGIASSLPATLDPGQGYFGPGLRIVASRDRSLVAGDPWTLFGEEPWRENPEVFEGTMTSAVAGFVAGWRGITSAVEGSVDVEWAFPSPIGFDWGERDFVQVVADGGWSMLALWNHTLSVRGHAMQTFGPEPAPAQRWSHVGGAGTLPTFGQAALRGDNLVFLQSSYSIPVPRLTLPVAGVPELVTRHAVGSAWVTDGPTPRWQQNLAVGVRFSVADLFVYFDPAEEDRSPTFSVSFGLPF